MASNIQEKQLQAEETGHSQRQRKGKIEGKKKIIHKQCKMLHRNYWANCGPIVFCSITISRPIRQAALSVLPEYTKNPFVGEDAPGLLQDKES